MNTNEELLTRGVEEVLDRPMLEKKLASGTPLRVKLGIDPTSPNLHLGRAIPLLKLRDFQALGHTVVFIIGDFTGIIGDTSDKDSERPMLTKESIEANLTTYFAQAGKLIDLEKAELHRNSTWLDKLTYREIGEHANCFSVADFIARDNIKRRLDAGKRVSLREVLYPLMQGYDSVEVRADVEMGGTDQRFNMLAGRALQERAGQVPQSIIMNPLIEGLDGRKMSSSFGNTVNLLDSPSDMFGKTMSLNDAFIVKYFELLTRVDLQVVRAHEARLAEGDNPRDIKLALSHEIVRMYHGQEAADEAQQSWISTFSDKEIPTEMQEIQVTTGTLLVDALVQHNIIESKTQVRRLLEVGAITNLDKDEKITDPQTACTEPLTLKIGKKTFVKIIPR